MTDETEQGAPPTDVSMENPRIKAVWTPSLNV